MRRLANSLLQSVRTAILGNPRLQRHIASHPRFWGWLGKRFSSEPLGLRLTVGAALASACLFFFLSVVQDLIANEAVVLADLRLLSLVQMYRTPGLNKVMLFLTYLGNWQVVTAGASLLVLCLALMRRWLWILALLVSIGGGEILVQLGKVGFGRPRPDLVNALIPAQGPSFPSGHALRRDMFLRAGRVVRDRSGENLESNGRDRGHDDCNSARHRLLADLSRSPLAI
jgi:hypothetical protein